MQVEDRTVETSTEEYEQAEELKSGWNSDKTLVVVSLDELYFGMELDDARKFAAALNDCIAVVEAARNGGN